MSYLLLGLFGIIAGLNASLFGFGGGIIIVPLIYHLYSNNPYSMQIAIATSTSIIIINSINSTFKQRHNILWNRVFPLIIYLGLGAILGVYLSNYLTGQNIRWLFILYLIYIIYKNITREHFNKHPHKVIHLNSYLEFFLGLIIGIVSVIIGVGGSIMTVPLMRKFGLSMKKAAAIANPLSLPVGLVGATGYILSAYSKNIYLGQWYLGYIYLPALLILTVGSFIGIPIGIYISNTITDKVHAISYNIILILVLGSMLFK